MPQIDWSHPLARYISFAWVAEFPDRDLVSGKLGKWNGSPFPRTSFPDGRIAGQMNGSSIEFGNIAGANFGNRSEQTMLAEVHMPKGGNGESGGYICGRIQSSWDYHLIVGESRQLGYAVGGDSYGIFYPSTSYMGGLAFMTGKPVLLGGTYDRVNRKIFCDGVPLASQAFSNAFSTSNDSFAIGARGGGGQNGSFGFSVGMVVLFTKALTDAEMAMIGGDVRQLFRQQRIRVYNDGTQFKLTQRRTRRVGNRAGVPMVDWSNPITRGLRIAVKGGHQFNLANNRPLLMTSGRITHGAGADGSTGWSMVNDGIGNMGWYSGTVASEEMRGVNEMTLMSLNYCQAPVDNPDSVGADFLRLTSQNQTAYGHAIGVDAYSQQKGLRANFRFASYGGNAGVSASGQFAQGNTYCVAATYRRNDAIRLFNNAKMVASNTVGDYALDTDTVGYGIWLGRAGTSGTQIIMLSLAWDRALSPDEIRSMADDPWQIMKQRTLPVYTQSIQGVIAKIRAALYMGGQGYVMQSPGGLSVKPLVLVNGSVRQRVASEGIPLVLDEGVVRTIAADETLQI